jgi:hypothetical protein
MIDMEGALFQRTKVNDTETPRICHLLALRQAGDGLPIAGIVKENVLASAERGKDGLEGLIDEFNKKVKAGNLGEDTKREYVSKLLDRIVSSYGINGPRASQRRLNHITRELHLGDPWCLSKT